MLAHLASRSLLGRAAFSSTLVYNKLRVTRLDEQTFTLFVEDSTTLGSLKKQISAVLSDSQIELVENVKNKSNLMELWSGSAKCEKEDTVQEGQ